jgi:hypothetical protein
VKIVYVRADDSNAVHARQIVDGQVAAVDRLAVLDEPPQNKNDPAPEVKKTADLFAGPELRGSTSHHVPKSDDAAIGMNR